MPSSMPLFVRLSTTEYNSRGFSLEDSVALTNLLKPIGISFYFWIFSIFFNFEGMNFSIKTKINLFHFIWLYFFLSLCSPFNYWI